jgi:Phage minor capsid protein 2
MRTKRQLAKDDAKLLAGFYVSAHEKIVKMITEGSTIAKRARAKELLVNINTVIDDLDVKTKDFIDKKIPIHYRKHAVDTAKYIKKVQGTVKFTQIHDEAILAFVDRSKAKFAVALETTKRKAQTVVNTILQENITRELAKSKILGETLDEATKNVIETITEQGITGVVDKRGRELNLASYARTLAYTEIAEAGRTGVRNLALENGFDLVVVSSHSSAHAECARWEGKVLSLTGASDAYPTLEKAKESGIFHPNCQHTYTVIDEQFVSDDMR